MKILYKEQIHYCKRYEMASPIQFSTGASIHRRGGPENLAPYKSYGLENFRFS
jgi:hypothetical protein